MTLLNNERRLDKIRQSDVRPSMSGWQTTHTRSEGDDDYTIVQYNTYECTYRLQNDQNIRDTQTAVTIVMRWVCTAGGGARF